MKDLEYIAAYFEGELPEGDRRSFEERCAQDEGLAEQVAQYILVKDALNLELAEGKRERFSALYKQVVAGGKPQKDRNANQVKIRLLYAAAACLALMGTWLMFFRSPDPKDIAKTYIAANFDQLSVQMSSGDELQAGIAAFNVKNYTKAILIFKSLVNDTTTRSEAVKNLGITYMVTGAYDEAIVQFDELAKMNLYINPGLFYKSIALLKKGDGNSVAQAKRNLRQVVAKDLAGSREAKAWLQEL